MSEDQKLEQPQAKLEETAQGGEKKPDQPPGTENQEGGDLNLDDLDLELKELEESVAPLALAAIA